MVLIGEDHPLYILRCGMLSRCYDSRNSQFNHYHSKGIKVFDEWKNNAEAFYQWALDNEWKPGLSVDRIDPDKDYEPSNCSFIPIIRYV